MFFDVVYCYSICNANSVFVENAFCLASYLYCFAVTLWGVLGCALKHRFGCVGLIFVTFFVSRANYLLIYQNFFGSAREFVVVITVCFSATNIHVNLPIFFILLIVLLFICKIILFCVKFL